jgi:Amt family ammonium transporter
MFGPFGPGGICGTWGGIAAGIFGHESLGAISNLNFLAQISGSITGVFYALTAGFGLYFILNKTYGLRMNEEEEYKGSDLTFHSIESVNAQSEFDSMVK